MERCAVTRLALSGHCGLPPDVSVRMDRELADAVREHAEVSPIVGVTCPAEGPDTMFARHLLDTGGEPVVGAPAREFRDG